MSSLEDFNKFRDYLKNKGILETDLPFLLFNENNKKSILIIHGSEASPCNTIELSEILYSKGYNVLSVLLEGHGEDKSNLYSGKVTWFDCYNSAKKYFKFLQAFSDDIYILGSSFGGSLAYLLSIELRNEISGIIAVSAPTHSRKDFSYINNWVRQVYLSIKEVEKNIYNISSPCLILHSIDDLVVKANQGFFAFDNISSSYKKLVLYDKVGHSLGFTFNNNEVANDIDNFIKNNFKEKKIRFKLENNNYYKVNIAGDFNNWSSKDLEMRLYNNEWLLDINLKPGSYQYKFVINDNNWILDPESEFSFTPNGNKNSFIRV